MFQIRILGFYLVSLSHLVPEGIRFLKLDVVFVELRKDSLTVGFSLCSRFVTAIPQWTLLAFLHIEMVFVARIIVLFRLSLVIHLVYSQMACGTCHGVRILVEREPVILGIQYIAYVFVYLRV